MAEIVLHKERGYYKEINEENTPVINELVNIIAGYYIDELVKFFDIETKKPQMSTNPQKVLEFLELGSMYMGDARVLLFQTEFTLPDNDIRWNVTLSFKKELTKKIVEAIDRSR